MLSSKKNKVPPILMFVWAVYVSSSTFKLSSVCAINNMSKNDKEFKGVNIPEYSVVNELMSENSLYKHAHGHRIVK